MKKEDLMFLVMVLLVSTMFGFIVGTIAGAR